MNGIYVKQRVMDFLNTPTLIVSCHCNQALKRIAQHPEAVPLSYVLEHIYFFPSHSLHKLLQTAFFSPKLLQKMWSPATLVFSRSKDILLKPNHIKPLSFSDTVKCFSLFTLDYEIPEFPFVLFGPLSPHCVPFALEISFIVMKLLTNYHMTNPKRRRLGQTFHSELHTTCLASFLSCFIGK